MNKAVNDIKIGIHYRDWMTDTPPHVSSGNILYSLGTSSGRGSQPLLCLQWPLTSTLEFSHDLLPTIERRHRYGLTPFPTCSRCPGRVEDGLHFFTSCPRVACAWDYGLHRAIMVSGIALNNNSLLYLAWPSRSARMEASITLAVITFTAWAWETRELPAALLPPDTKVRVVSGPGRSWWPTSIYLLNSPNPDPHYGFRISPSNDPWSKPSKITVNATLRTNMGE
jgi:hypothetical protein